MVMRWGKDTYPMLILSYPVRATVIKPVSFESISKNSKTNKNRNHHDVSSTGSTTHPNSIYTSLITAVTYQTIPPFYRGKREINM